MVEADCFYTQNHIADGEPFNYEMINYTGIAGGTGPTGSIKSKNKCVSIPRSKKAQNLHRIGFAIKLIFLLTLLSILSIGFIQFPSYYHVS